MIGKAKGKNINIAWSTRYPENIGDKEYLYAFNKIIIPVLREFNPQLILVSAGFDCAIGDPLGNLSVTPIGFENMTNILKNIQTKIVLVLEGGYNIDIISRAVVACLRVLLGSKPIPFTFDINKVDKSAKIAVMQTFKEISPYWICLNNFYKDFLYFSKSDDAIDDY